MEKIDNKSLCSFALFVPVERKGIHHTVLYRLWIVGFLQRERTECQISRRRQGQIKDGG